ncbi:Holliday junction DNA helicase ruvB-like protein [Novymonas esmeraldas]|uniref:Holliday junction DNA helicase ruvB-like protein n=1 Tax=Novymonas esmeraldas TaxID=1808958 RepID=A0AAW0EWM0_9TRYP
MMATARGVPPVTVVQTNMISTVGRTVLGWLERLKNAISETPLYFWVYIGALVWITRQLTNRTGKSTRRITVAGKQVTLNQAEAEMASNVVDIDKIDVDFSDVGGLDDVKDALTEHIKWPFQHQELFSGRTVRSHPKGVLLYGPPGTGKTLLARALAKELGCSFINVNTESIFSKWVGDTERNAAAVFTLAAKISPCVIFVDEIDSLLSSRSAMDATPHMHAKTIFMTHWDGLEKDNTTRIIVVGATNRRFTIDDAIRRRLPLQLEVPPPDAKARERILSILLAHDLEGNPKKEGLIRYVALKTAEYTGSDLSELCKAAALMPLREMKSMRGDGAPSAAAAPEAVPPLTQQHFDKAMERVKASK